MASASAAPAAAFANKVVYEIYPKSFCDSDADGWGDLRGVISKLDYLAALGVDYIWLTPFTVSPQVDNGYDVADYRAVDPRYGTMEDVEELIAGARERGMGIMMDMVFNHSSSEHEWFRRALAGDERYQAYYHFYDGEPDTPPTNWSSKFGGSAWEWSSEVGKWYLHLFDPRQPDLNWENPELMEEFADIVRFWRAKGVEGFRFDVVNLVSKPDVLEDDFEGDGRRFYTDGPRIHEHLRELVARSGIGDMITVGEMNSSCLPACVGYSNPANHELSMVFNFHHMKTDYEGNSKWVRKLPDISQLQGILATWQEGMQAGGGWSALFWDNHDQPRAVSRFCDDGALRVESTRMLGLVSFCMRGTPYIYQGDELGMTNGHFSNIERYRDVESLNHYRILQERGHTAEEALAIVGLHSRDNGRLPMQWGAGPHAGFSAAEPWIPLAESTDACDQRAISAEAAAASPASTLAFYRQLTRLRHEMPVIATGKVRFLDAEAAPVISYARFGELPVGEPYEAAAATAEDLLAPGSLLVLGNFSAGGATIGPEAAALLAAGGWEPLLCGYGDGPAPAPEPGLVLRPYEGVVFIRR